MEHLSSTMSSHAVKPPAQKCAAKCTKMVEPRQVGDWWMQSRLCPEHQLHESLAEAAEAEREKHAQAVKRLGLPPRFRVATLENFKGELQPKASEIAVRFVQSYKPGKTAKGLYLYGAPGTGKTHLASAIGNQLLMAEHARFVTAPELLLEIKKTFNDPHSDGRFLDRLSQTKLLILDDLGSEKPTEWVQETLFVLIDRRYTNHLPTIITSNLSLDQLAERLTYRVASRIAEMCEVVELRAGDYRIRKTK